MDITKLLDRWSAGDTEALSELLPVVYSELKVLADRYLRRERDNHTLQPTALVHEAYLRLTDLRSARFNNRVHFYGAVAQVMRQVLVDHARRRLAGKRGSGALLVQLDEASDVGSPGGLDVLALDDALERLSRTRAQPAKVVELRYFGGLSIDETAEYLQISPATVKRHLTFARAWLYRALNE